MSASTFSAVLSELVRAESARPAVTFYDDATGERVELSVVTFANWVSKTAGLVQDELEIDSRGLVLVDLPTHWLGVVWLGACWTVGQCVTTDAALVDEADLVVCGPDGMAEYAGRAADQSVVALSLRPLGARFAAPVPAGVVDFGAVVLAQPDMFIALDPPGPDDPAWREDRTTWTQLELLSAARAEPLVDTGGRLLTDVNACSVPGRSTVLSPLLQRGSAVWVAHPDPARWDSRFEEERATAQLRGT